MAYFASIHQACSVNHAVKAKFMSPEVSSLIIAKTNRVEVYDLSSDQLNLTTNFTVYGKVTALLTLKPANSTTDHLFIATDRYDYLTISWNSSRGIVQNERKAQDVSDRFLRDAPYGPLYLSDPAGRMLGLHVYEGLFLAIPVVQPIAKTGRKKQSMVDIGNLEEHTSIRIKELKILDMAFLHNTLNPVLAILHKDGSPDATQLVTYEIVTSGGYCDLKTWSIKITELESGANILIPVKEPVGGVLIVGEQIITHVTDHESITKRVLSEPSITFTWTIIDETRFLLGDEFGNLKMLWLEVDEDHNVCDIKLQKIGETSTASKLVYLDNGHVFVGSQHGDSQLIKITMGVSKCQIVQDFKSLAPILDFCVLSSHSVTEDSHQNLYSSGQTRIVIGSGGFRDGGLRSMKSGVGLEDSGILIDDIEGAQAVWALKSNSSKIFDDTLVVSSIYGTRVLHFDPYSGVDELQDFWGFSLEEETVLACNLAGGRFLQVTTSGFKLIDAEGGTILAEVSLPAKVTNASVNAEFLVCSVGRKSVEIYALQNDLKMIHSRSFENEIACLYASSFPCNLCALGFWSSSSVLLLGLPGLETIAQENLGYDNITVPRSVIVAQILENKSPNLLIGMGDGTLHVFSVNTGPVSLQRMKSVTLSTQAFYFFSIPQDNRTVNVFAACDHPSLIYEDDGRLGYSAVTANRVTHLCPFNAEAFPSCMAVIAATELKLSVVDTTRTVHIDKLNIGEVVRRVAYCEERKLFGLATVKSDIDPKTGQEHYNCFMHIIDDLSFTKVHEYPLTAGELVEALICANLDNGDGTTSERFVLGTGIQNIPAISAVSGRILVFEIDERSRIKLVTEKNVEHSVKALAICGDTIVVALGHSVNLYSFSFQSFTNPQLVQLASWPTQSDPCDLSVWGDMITVGDLMRGPLLLQITVDGGFYDFKEVSRTFKTTWTTAVEMIDKETIVSGDSEGNVSIWKKNDSIVAEDQKRLEIVSDVKLGEMVNRIRRVNNQFLPDAAVQPKAYLGTVNGSVYLLGSIQESHIPLLMQLQINLAKVIKSVGDISFNRFRAFSTPGHEEEEPNRFVDGDFIGQFLDLPDEIAEAVVNGAGNPLDSLEATVVGVRFIVEGLRRLL